MKSTSITKRKTFISNGITRICSHYIEWQLEDKNIIQLSDMDIEHIQNSLIENNVAGELCTINPQGKEICGWWSIQ